MQKLPVLAMLGAFGCAQVVGLGPERERGSTTASVGAGGAGGASTAGGGGQAPQCEDGSIAWVKQFGDASRQLARDVAAEPAGGAWIAGLFGGQLDLGGAVHASVGSLDMFVARFDAAGSHLASRRFGDASDQQAGIRLAATADGGVVMVGNFTGTVDFGDGPHTASASDAFVARYDGAGTHVWSRVYPGADDQKALAVAVDRQSGDVVVAGHFNLTIDLGEGPMQADKSDGFLVKLDPDGAFAWGRAIAAPGVQYVNAVAVDDAGRIAFTGSTTEPIDLGLGIEDAIGGDTDGFVAMYDPDGIPLWAEVYASAGTQTVTRVAFGGAGRIAIGGVQDGRLELGAGHVVPAGDSFVATLNAAGDPLFSRGLLNVPDVPALAADGSGAVLFASRFHGQTNRVAGGLVAQGGDDGLVAKLDAELAHTWTLSIGSVQDDDVRAISVDDAGNVYMLGQFQGTALVTGCGSFAGAGLDADLLFIKRSP